MVEETVRTDCAVPPGVRERLPGEIEDDNPVTMGPDGTRLIVPVKP